MVLLKSPKEEHLFTDMAYISILGESAASSKKIVTRYDWLDNRIEDIQLETTGSFGDKTCELKFKLDELHVSVDVWEKDFLPLQILLRCLVKLNYLQDRNIKLLWEFRNLSAEVGEKSVSIEQYLSSSQIDFIISTESKINPHMPFSYIAAFAELESSSFSVEIAKSAISNKDAPAFKSGYLMKKRYFIWQKRFFSISNSAEIFFWNNVCSVHIQHM